MSVRVAEGMLEYMQATGGSCQFIVRGANNLEAVTAALAAAAAEIRRIQHPEEPDEALPNFVSKVTVGPDGPTFWVDVKDQFIGEPELAARVLGIVRGHLDRLDGDGELGFPRPASPPPPIPPFDPATVFIARGTYAESGSVGLVAVAAAIAGDADLFRPASVSPVLWRLAEEVGRATLDDDERQGLRPLAYAIARSADETADLLRRRSILDWLVRDQTPFILASVGIDEGLGLANLPAMDQVVERKPTLEALVATVRALHRRLIDIVPGAGPRPRHPARCWRNNDYFAPDNCTVAAVHAVGRLVPAAGTRIEELLRVRADALEAEGFSLADVAWSKIWYEAVRDAWLPAWADAFRDASATAPKPPTRLFPDWSADWPPAAALYEPLHTAAASRAAGEASAWEPHIRPALVETQSWRAVMAKCEAAGFGNWAAALREAFGPHFDAVVDDAFFDSVTRCGVASFAETCQRLAGELAVLDAREAAYEQGASDAEATIAGQRASQAVHRACSSRLRVLIEVLGTSPP